MFTLSICSLQKVEKGGWYSMWMAIVIILGIVAAIFAINSLN